MKLRAAISWSISVGTSNGPTETINFHLELLRDFALVLTIYMTRSVLETGGFRPTAPAIATSQNRCTPTSGAH